VRTHTGFAIGGVAPAGHSLEKVFIEKQLSRYPELWAAAGHPHTVFRLTYAQLLQITGGATAELAA
jgi:prolyl-tRNA editing enzyme YbaK/EbsC (Cys-tRNA(Pro) deacylase)